MILQIELKELSAILPDKPLKLMNPSSSLSSLQKKNRQTNFIAFRLEFIWHFFYRAIFSMILAVNLIYFIVKKVLTAVLVVNISSIFRIMFKKRQHKSLSLYFILLVNVEFSCRLEWIERVISYCPNILFSYFTAADVKLFQKDWKYCRKELIFCPNDKLPLMYTVR